MLYRNKQTNKIQRIASSVMDSWTPPNVGFVHWDGKLMETLGNHNDHQEEHLPALLLGKIYEIICLSNLMLL